MLGQAWFDYWQRDRAFPLHLHTSYCSATEEMPVGYFFRDANSFPLIEQYALSICRGHVLDVGAGVGAHAVFLQENQVSVTTLEVSPTGARIQRERGIQKVVLADYRTYTGGGYDTVLLLMNGIGVVGTLSELPGFLRQADQWLQPDGQLIVDSSDIAYLYEDEPLPTGYYYGEVRYQYEYRGQRGAWFPWLYVDFETLDQVAHSSGWSAQLVFQDENGHYLARMTRL